MSKSSLSTCTPCTRGIWHHSAPCTCGIWRHCASCTRGLWRHCLFSPVVMLSAGADCDQHCDNEFSDNINVFHALIDPSFQHYYIYHCYICTTRSADRLNSNYIWFRCVLIQIENDSRRSTPQPISMIYWYLYLHNRQDKTSVFRNNDSL